MSRNTRLIRGTPEQVWEVLSDGWLYPLFVVGASRMREVDDDWPAVGSKLHHSVGTWPALIDDNTEVLESRPLSMLRLRARGWPMGEANVVVRLTAAGPDTEVVIEEQAVRGPGAFLPDAVMDVPLAWRNVETLRRLAYVVEGRT